MEQEICYESEIFLFSKISSWSKNILYQEGVAITVNKTFHFGYKFIGFNNTEMQRMVQRDKSEKNINNFEAFVSNMPNKT